MRHRNVFSGRLDRCAKGLVLHSDDGHDFARLVPSQLGARYAFDIDSREFTLRARVDNVANHNYWASAGGYPGQGYLTVGAPRTFGVHFEGNL